MALIVSVLTEREPFSPLRGGAVARAVASCAPYIAPGDELVVLAPGRAEPSDYGVGPQVEVRRFAAPRRRFRGVERLRPAVAAALAARHHRLLAAADVIEINNRPDWLPILRKGTRAKLVLHLFNDVPPTNRRLAQQLSHADATIVMSEYMRDALLQRVDCDALSVVPGGVDSTLFAPTGPRVDGRLIFTGRLIPEKGVLELVQAVRAVAAAGLRPQLRIVGSSWFANAPRTEYTRMVAEATERANAEVPHLVHLEGFLPHGSDLARLTASAELAVVPSVWPEPFGLVTVEALSSGTPVVGSDRGALPEIVGGCGYAIDPADTEAFAAAIIDGLTRSDRDELSRRARQRAVREYDWSVVAAKWWDVLRP